MTRKLLKRALVGLSVALSGAALGVTLTHDLNLSWRGTFDITYPDLIAVLLTGIGIILAALAVFLGGFALYGWASIKTAIAESAEQVISRRFEPEGELFTALVERVAVAAKRESLAGIVSVDATDDLDEEV